MGGLCPHAGGTCSATLQMLRDLVNPPKPALSDEQDLFLDWLLSVQKTPPTQKAWCDENGVKPERVTAWKKQRKFLLEWERRARDFNISVDRTQGVLDTLWTAASRGDVNAAREYLKYVDKLLPPKQVERDADVQALSDEELESELRELLDGG